MFAGTLALASAGVVAAQSTATQDPNRPQTPTTTQQPSTAAMAQTTTVVGCLYRERDVPGRTPNVAERAGVLEDYILASVEKKQSAGTPGQTTPEATGTSGMKHSMFKLEHMEDDKLRALVGKRVEVTGKIDADDMHHGAAAGAATATTTGTATGAATGTTTGTTGAQSGTQQPKRDRSLGPDDIELPEFEVTSIREIEGTCPAKPDAPAKR
jgi:hypothetical protein